MDAMVQRFRDRLTQGEDDFETNLHKLKRVRLQVIAAQRGVLLEARDNGEFGAALLSAALENLDADQISLELKGRSGDE
jgi:CPA1 family monovalent cation:H+ antiporter